MVTCISWLKKTAIFMEYFPAKLSCVPWSPLINIIKFTVWNVALDLVNAYWKYLGCYFSRRALAVCGEYTRERKLKLYWLCKVPANSCPHFIDLAWQALDHLLASCFVCFILFITAVHTCRVNGIRLTYSILAWRFSTCFLWELMNLNVSIVK